MSEDAYLAAHLAEALAEDPRVAEPGLHVVVGPDAVVVSGTVGHPGRQAALAEVLGPLVGDRKLVDLTDVAGAGTPPVERV